MGFGTGGATSRYFTYSYPDPFICPIIADSIYAIPFDARYLEEIMFAINLARGEVWDKEPWTYTLYGSDRRVINGNYVPNASYKYNSQLNNNLSIVNFIELVEQIKNAIDDTIEEPDSKKAHFARCFNMGYYTGIPFISTGLLERDPSLKTALENDGYPFYTFPENISGETMHGVFHRFDYVLPNVKHPLRDVAVRAFPNARSKLTDGIPLLDRMQDGEWPITKEELTTILGMSIFSKDPRRLPEKRDNSQTEFDQYKLTDSKRIFSSMCSFVIQMLRYNVPNMEDFPYNSNVNKAWARAYTYGAIFCGRGPDGCLCNNYYYNYTKNCKAHGFRAGLWAVGGIGGSLSDDGYMLRVPPPYAGGTLHWFTGQHRPLEIGVAPIGPWGFAPFIPMARWVDQDSSKNYFWTFNRYQTLEIATVDDEEWVAQNNPYSLGANIEIKLAYKRPDGRYGYYPYIYLGGFYSMYNIKAHESNTAEDVVTLDNGRRYTNLYQSSANSVTFAKLPVKRASLYKLFKNGGTPDDSLSTYGNWITDIIVTWYDSSQHLKYCGSVTPGILGYNHVGIKKIGIFDDKVRPPEDFIYPED